MVEEHRGAGHVLRQAGQVLLLREAAEIRFHLGAALRVGVVHRHAQPRPHARQEARLHELQLDAAHVAAFRVVVGGLELAVEVGLAGLRVDRHGVAVGGEVVVLVGDGLHERVDVLVEHVGHEGAAGIGEVVFEGEVVLGRVHRVQQRVGAAGEVVRAVEDERGDTGLEQVDRRPRHHLGGGEADLVVVVQVQVEVQRGQVVGKGLARVDVDVVVADHAAAVGDRFAGTIADLLQAGAELRGVHRAQADVAGQRAVEQRGVDVGLHEGIADLHVHVAALGLGPVLRPVFLRVGRDAVRGEDRVAVQREEAGETAELAALPARLHRVGTIQRQRRLVRRGKPVLTPGRTVQPDAAFGAVALVVEVDAALHRREHRVVDEVVLHRAAERLHAVAVGGGIDAVAGQRHAAEVGVHARVGHREIADVEAMQGEAHRLVGDQRKARVKAVVWIGGDVRADRVAARVRGGDIRGHRPRTVAPLRVEAA